MLQLKDELSFCLPSVTLPCINLEEDISESIFKKIKTDLKYLRCNTNLLSEDNYKFIFSDNNKVYALIDISLVDITSLQLSKTSSIWFALPTEIINIKYRLWRIRVFIGPNPDNFFLKTSGYD